MSSSPANSGKPKVARVQPEPAPPVPVVVDPPQQPKAIPSPGAFSPNFTFPPPTTRPLPISLRNYQGYRPVSTPTSLRACAAAGIKPKELVERLPEDFRATPTTSALLYDTYEKHRQAKLEAVKREYEAITKTKPGPPKHSLPSLPETLQTVQQRMRKQQEEQLVEMYLREVKVRQKLDTVTAGLASKEKQHETYVHAAESTQSLKLQESQKANAEKLAEVAQRYSERFSERQAKAEKAVVETDARISAAQLARDKKLEQTAQKAMETNEKVKAAVEKGQQAAKERATEILQRLESKDEAIHARAEAKAKEEHRRQELRKLHAQFAREKHEQAMRLADFKAGELAKNFDEEAEWQRQQDRYAVQIERASTAIREETESKRRALLDYLHSGRMKEATAAQLRPPDWLKSAVEARTNAVSGTPASDQKPVLVPQPPPTKRHTPPTVVVVPPGEHPRPFNAYEAPKTTAPAAVASLVPHPPTRKQQLETRPASPPRTRFTHRAREEEMNPKRYYACWMFET